MGNAMRKLLGLFDDNQMEAGFRLTERKSLVPYVRWFAIVSSVVVIAYKAVNAAVLVDSERVRALTLLGVWLAVSAGYAGVTFWKHYVRHPAIDFVFLALKAILITQINLLIFDVIDTRSDGLYSDGDINRMIVSVFAAVAFAGRLPILIVWICFHAAMFLFTVLLAHPNGLLNGYEAMGYAGSALGALFINWLLGSAHGKAFALQFRWMRSVLVTRICCIKCCRWQRHADSKPVKSLPTVFRMQPLPSSIL